jgi:mRNA interferase YafQ
MYHIHRTKDFDKSYKRVKESGKLKRQAIETLNHVINTLALGYGLPAEYNDHQLTGERQGQRECHIKGDLLLIYKIKKKELVLVLVDFGSHPYLDL